MMHRDSHSRSWAQQGKQVHLVQRAHEVMKAVVNKFFMFTNSLPFAPWRTSSEKHPGGAGSRMSHNADYATQTGRIRGFGAGFMVIIADDLRRISRYAQGVYVKNGAQIGLLAAVRSPLKFL
jgi:hypothetical protein